MEMNYLECFVILICGIFMSFKNIIFGVWLLPMIVATTTLNSLQLLLSLGILAEGIFTVYLSLKLAGVFVK